MQFSTETASVLSSLPLFPGRPPFVPYQGGKLWILVHDHWYLGRRRGFLEKIKKSHPDRNRHNQATAHTRNLLEQLRSWRELEADWYAQFGLTVPEKRTQCDSKGVSNQRPSFILFIKLDK